MREELKSTARMQDANSVTEHGMRKMTERRARERESRSIRRRGGQIGREGRNDTQGKHNTPAHFKLTPKKRRRRQPHIPASSSIPYRSEKGLNWSGSPVFTAAVVVAVAETGEAAVVAAA